jgi:hypothetical protein
MPCPLNKQVFRRNSSGFKERGSALNEQKNRRKITKEGTANKEKVFETQHSFS